MAAKPQPGKFADVFDSRLNAPPPEMPGRIEATSGTPRRTGKRSNPDFEQYSVLLRKVSKKTAVRKLEDANDRRDFSELIQSLLDEWLTLGKA